MMTIYLFYKVKTHSNLKVIILISDTLKPIKNQRRRFEHQQTLGTGGMVATSSSRVVSMTGRQVIVTLPVLRSATDKLCFLQCCSIGFTVCKLGTAEVMNKKASNVEIILPKNFLTRQLTIYKTFKVLKKLIKRSIKFINVPKSFCN